MGFRYASLDGLRGIAAIIVVLHHVVLMRDAPSIAPHGYLAVDFFLMLSGFVLAKRYQEPLSNDLPFSVFMRQRIVRLYPIAVVGILLGFGKLWLEYFVGQGSEPLSSVIIACVLNLFVLPYISPSHFRSELFPTNLPIWSLLAEIVINAIWGALTSIGVRWSFIVIAMLISGIVLGYWALAVGISQLGFQSKYLLGAVARISFSFLLGVMAARADVRVIPRVPPAVILIALAGLLAVPWFGAWWDLFSLYFGLPAILLLGIANGLETKTPVRSTLGELSYPLYALHYPILLLLSGFRHKFFPASEVGYFITIGIFSAVALAYILSRFYDRTARKIMSRLL